MSLQASKQNIREHIQELRTALPEEARAQAAKQFCERFAQDVEISEGKIVAGYWPMRAELDIRPVLRMLDRAGVTCCLPVVQSRDEPLLFRRWGANTALTSGVFGVDVPPEDADILIPDIVLVPLTAFDHNGHRIGYGAGHYDRTLRQIAAEKQVQSIGVGYACQEVEMVPAEPHDIRLDMIVTDQKIYRINE